MITIFILFSKNRNFHFVCHSWINEFTSILIIFWALSLVRLFSCGFLHEIFPVRRSSPQVLSDSQEFSRFLNWFCLFYHFSCFRCAHFSLASLVFGGISICPFPCPALCQAIALELVARAGVGLWKGKDFGLICVGWYTSLAALNCWGDVVPGFSRWHLFLSWCLGYFRCSV